MKHSITILTKRSIRNKSTLVLIFLLLNLTIIQSAASGANIVDLEGDKDGFGVGCPIANGLHFTDYGEILNDYREPWDPNFTDNWVNGDQTWTHSYDLMGLPAASASLEIYVACIADNPAWNADVLVNGVSVGTIPPDASDFDLTRILTFNIPVGLLANPDGITIDLNNDLDGYTIDYSQLTVQAVPAPGAIVLCGIGTAMLGWLRKRKTL